MLFCGVPKLGVVVTACLVLLPMAQVVDHVMYAHFKHIILKPHFIYYLNYLLKTPKDKLAKNTRSNEELFQLSDTCRF